MIMALLFASFRLFVGDDSQTPVAMVLTSKGGVTLVRGSAPPIPAGPMTLLQPGDRLAAPADGEAVMIFLADGQRERLLAKSRATVGRKGCTPAEAVQAVQGPKLAQANLASLRKLAAGSTATVFMAKSEPPKVMPLFGSVVLTDRPELSWPPEKTDAYLVEFFTVADGNERQLWTATVKAPTLPYPAKEKPLELSNEYGWRVTSVQGEGEGVGKNASAFPIVESKFRVVTKSQKELLSDLKKQEDSKDPAELVLVATCYEAQGVQDEAARVFQRLAALCPEVASFQVWLASYYDRAGRPELADKARAVAEKLGAK